jgi:hypothetical protein
MLADRPLAEDLRATRRLVESGELLRRVGGSVG